jgi:hypothetical protein
MKPTRRGFLGIVGGAVVAAVVPFKLEAVEKVQEVKEAVSDPTFSAFEKIMDTGPPWVAGDVLMKKRTGELFVVRVVTGPLNPSPLLEMKATGNWESELMAVPINNLDSPIGIPVALIKRPKFTRVGKAHNEGRDFPG